MFKVLSPVGEVRARERLALAARHEWGDHPGRRVGLLENGGDGISIKTSSFRDVLTQEHGLSVTVGRKLNRSHEATPAVLDAFDGCAGVICAVAE